MTNPCRFPGSSTPCSSLDVRAEVSGVDGQLHLCFCLPTCLPACGCPCCPCCCCFPPPHTHTPSAMISWMEDEIRASPDMAVVMVRWGHTLGGGGGATVVGCVCSFSSLIHTQHSTVCPAFVPLAAVSPPHRHTPTSHLTPHTPPPLTTTHLSPPPTHTQSRPGLHGVLLQPAAGVGPRGVHSHASIWRTRQLPGIQGGEGGLPGCDTGQCPFFLGGGAVCTNTVCLYTHIHLAFTLSVNTHSHTHIQHIHQLNP